MVHHKHKRFFHSVTEMQLLFTAVVDLCTLSQLLVDSWGKLILKPSLVKCNLDQTATKLGEETLQKIKMLVHCMSKLELRCERKGKLFISLMKLYQTVYSLLSLIHKIRKTQLSLNS